jgi:hypothetical protein
MYLHPARAAAIAAPSSRLLGHVLADALERAAAARHPARASTMRWRGCWTHCASRSPAAGSRHSNDNGLTETKNGAVVRKEFG